MWKTIDKILYRTSGTITISEIKDGNTVVKSQHQILQKLNKHFVIIGLKLASKLEAKPDYDPVKYMRADADQKSPFKVMSEEAMLTSLNMLKNEKAPGPDGVTTNLVKDAAQCIAKPLIFNASLKQGILPNIWKLAKITPVYKSGARNEEAAILHL